MQKLFQWYTKVNINRLLFFINLMCKKIGMVSKLHFLTKIPWLVLTKMQRYSFFDVDTTFKNLKCNNPRVTFWNIFSVVSFLDILTGILIEMLVLLCFVFLRVWCFQECTLQSARAPVAQEKRRRGQRPQALHASDLRSRGFVQETSDRKCRLQPRIIFKYNV